MRWTTLFQGGLFLGLAFGGIPASLVLLSNVRDGPVLDAPGLRIGGGLLIVGGLAVSLYCTHLFRRLGRGTPVPCQPPARLVVAGPYLRTRNPIYLAYAAVLLGLTAATGHLILGAYALAFLASMAGWVVWVEEPELRRRFGDAYTSYCREVPRWIGRRAARDRAPSGDGAFARSSPPPLPARGTNLPTGSPGSEGPGQVAR